MIEGAWDNTKNILHSCITTTLLSWRLQQIFSQNWISHFWEKNWTKFVKQTIWKWSDRFNLTFNFYSDLILNKLQIAKPNMKVGSKKKNPHDFSSFKKRKYKHNTPSEIIIPSQYGLWTSSLQNKCKYFEWNHVYGYNPKEKKIILIILPQWIQNQKKCV